MYVYVCVHVCECVYVYACSVYAYTHIFTYATMSIRGKKSLVLEPGTSKISIRTSIYFHPMSDGQVKKLKC